MTKSVSLAKLPKVVVPTVEAPVSDKRTEANGVVRARSSFGRTFYWLDTTKETSDKCAPQMQGILKWMKDNKITSQAKAMNGAEIGQKAVADGAVKTTKLTGPVIFAYYARAMEKRGLTLSAVTHARTGKTMA